MAILGIAIHSQALVQFRLIGWYEIWFLLDSLMSFDLIKLGWLHKLLEVLVKYSLQIRVEFRCAISFIHIYYKSIEMHRVA